MTGPAGPRPTPLTLSRVAIYAMLVTTAALFLVPLYVMIVTSLKTMDEIRIGQLFAWPAQPTLDAWRTAWSEACTGLACEGVRVGFWNSVAIVAPVLYVRGSARRRSGVTR